MLYAIRLGHSCTRPMILMTLLLALLPADSTDASKPVPPLAPASAYVVVEERMTVPMTVDAIYDAVVNNPLEETLHGSDGIPDVIGTTVLTPGWAKVGSRRIVHLADSSRVTEQLLKLDRPNYFSYVVWDIRNSLGTVAAHVHGEWWFTPSANGTTEIIWRYSIKPKSGIVRPLVALFVKPRIRKFLQQTLANFHTLATTGAAPVPKRKKQL